VAELLLHFDLAEVLQSQSIGCFLGIEVLYTPIVKLFFSRKVLSSLVEESAVAVCSDWLARESFGVFTLWQALRNHLSACALTKVLAIVLTFEFVFLLSCVVSVVSVAKQRLFRFVGFILKE